MNKKFLSYYNKELSFLKDMGQEFASSFPKVAARLGLDKNDIPDPYVERLLEGVSFLTARTQLKLDAEYPRFVQRILEVVYPNFLSPTPASGIVQFEANNHYYSDVTVTLDRGQILRSLPINELNANCPFSITRKTEITPLQLEKVHYTDNLDYLPVNNYFLKRNSKKIQSALRLDFSLSVSGRCSDMLPEKLPIFLGSDLSKSSSLLYLLISKCAGTLCHSYEDPKQWQIALKNSPEHIGFEQDEALNFNLHKSIPAFRILQEYATLPEKFVFIEQSGIKQALAEAERSGFMSSKPEQYEEIIHEKGSNKRVIVYKKRYFSLSFLFQDHISELLDLINRNDIALNAVPVVNLFKHRGSRFPINVHDREHHVLIDRTQPLNYEIYAINQVKGFDTHNHQHITFAPLYQTPDQGLFPKNSHHSAYFSARREDRIPSDQVRRNGFRSSYLGSEVFLSLANTQDFLFKADIQHLSVDAWCTSRDLPLFIPRDGDSDFLIEGALPVQRIKLVSKLSLPQAAPSEDESLWPLLNQLSLNHLSLTDVHGEDASLVLKALLSVYVKPDNDFLKNQIESITHLQTQAIDKVMRHFGAVSVARGVQITITLDEALLGGIHPFLFCSVIYRYLQRLVSINSFIELRAKTLQQGTIAIWPALVGSRKAL